MYRCHINFEVASAAHLFQYMFKYIHKGISSLTSMVINHSSPFLGPDTAKVHIKHSDAVVDEIEDFWQARYLSTGEAAWQILGFCLTTKDPAVTALPVHAPHSLLHLQYSHVDHQSSPMSKLDHYFIHPQGFFFDENLNCTSFDDLTYAEYYRLFHLQNISLHKYNNHSHFLETPNHLGVPIMSVVHHTGQSHHITRMQPLSPSQGEHFHI